MIKPADCKPGLRVRYFPVRGWDWSFTGTVREGPWQLGHGSWVTHLADMEPAYGIWRGQPERRHVHAAALDHLEALVQEG